MCWFSDVMEILTYLFVSLFILKPEDKLGEMAGFFKMLGDDITNSLKNASNIQ
jgi:hypothetical protein